MHWIDPDSLRPLKSTVTRFLFNPKGDADGMLLSSGLEAHFPPHLSSAVLAAVKVGDAVTLYGVKPKAAEMIACVAIETLQGKRIDDHGPPRKKKKHQRKECKGAHETLAEPTQLEDGVERLLHGPKGEVRGALLVAGSILRFPRHLAEDAERVLKPGAVIIVRGHACSVSGTTVIDAEDFRRSKARPNRVASKSRV